MLPYDDGEATSVRFDLFGEEDGAVVSTRRTTAGDAYAGADHVFVMNDDARQLRSKPFHGSYR